MYEIQQLPSLRARGTVHKTWNCINFYWHLLKVLTIFQELFPSSMYQLINSSATLFCQWENQSAHRCYIRSHNNKGQIQYKKSVIWPQCILPLIGLDFDGSISFFSQDTRDRIHIPGSVLEHSQAYTLVSSGLIATPSYSFPLNNAHEQTSGAGC